MLNYFNKVNIFRFIVEDLLGIQLVCIKAPSIKTLLPFCNDTSLVTYAWYNVLKCNQHQTLTLCRRRKGQGDWNVVCVPCNVASLQTQTGAALNSNKIIK